MDFAGEGFTMSHAIGPKKPWTRFCYALDRVLKRIDVGAADREFLMNVRHQFESTPTGKGTLFG